MVATSTTAVGQGFSTRLAPAMPAPSLPTHRCLGCVVRLVAYLAGRRNRQKTKHLPQDKVFFCMYGFYFWGFCCYFAWEISGSNVLQSLLSEFWCLFSPSVSRIGTRFVDHIPTLLLNMADKCGQAVYLFGRICEKMHINRSYRLFGCLPCEHIGTRRTIHIFRPHLMYCLLGLPSYSQPILFFFTFPSNPCPFNTFFSVHTLLMGW